MDFDIYSADKIVLDMLCDRLVLKDRIIPLNSLEVVLSSLLMNKDFNV